VPIDDLVQLAQRSAEPDASADAHCLPLRAGGVLVGVLGRRAGDLLGEAEQRAVEAAAAVIAIGIRNMQLFLEARELSLLDGLTGCLNRRHALQTLDSELRRVRRTGTPLSIVMFDLDHFKAVNDRYGHLRGDELLASVGATLSHVTRSSDVRCRYGGDEFLVILPDTPIAGAQQVAEGIRADVATLRIARDETVAATISVGVAAAEPGELDATALIARADAALYRAKAARNRVCVAQVDSARAAELDPLMDDVLPAEAIAEPAATPWIG
jgi:diguanylate cyclase (GGDEF)-like protein